MIKVIKGNLVSAVLNSEVDMMMHVCNCQGVMGSGIAKEVKERTPEAYKAYKNSSLQLGGYSRVARVVNLYAQDNYGYGKRHLNYGALSVALTGVFDDLDEEGFAGTIGVPYKMGSDRAGGDWTIVLEILEALADYYGIKLVIYKL